MEFSIGLSRMVKQHQEGSHPRFIDAHKEGSHPRFMDAYNCTCIACALSSC